MEYRAWRSEAAGILLFSSFWASCLYQSWLLKFGRRAYGRTTVSISTPKLWFGYTMVNSRLRNRCADHKANSDPWSEVYERGTFCVQSRVYCTPTFTPANRQKLRLGWTQQNCRGVTTYDCLLCSFHFRRYLLSTNRQNLGCISFSYLRIRAIRLKAFPNTRLSTLYDVPSSSLSIQLEIVITSSYGKTGSIFITTEAGAYPQTLLCLWQ